MNRLDNPAPVPRPVRSLRTWLLGAVCVLGMGLAFAAVWSRTRRPDAAAIGVRFVDITEAAGIQFRHHNGATGKKLLPDTSGGGCCFLDFDRDGDQDLLFINGAALPGDDATSEPVQTLYANDGTGKFSDVSSAVGLAATFYGMGAAVGDYDGDGWDDIFFTAVGGDHLYRNLEGKTFVEVTQDAGIPGAGPYDWSTGASFLDYDNDGLLDLFVCRYATWSPGADLAQDFVLKALARKGVKRAYVPPQKFPGSQCKLYRNVGKRFVDVSAPAGIEVRDAATGGAVAKALGVAVHDLDGDGFLEIAVANDTARNFLFHNQGNGTFKEIGVESGIAFDEGGKARSGMGIDWVSEDVPGNQGIVITNFDKEITALFCTTKPALASFSDDANLAGIGGPSLDYLKFGVMFLDFDLDGRQDILQVNGHLDPDIGLIDGKRFAQPAQLFRRIGKPGSWQFEELGAETLGPDLFRPLVGRGCAYADIDKDGDLDVALVANGGPARLLRNERSNKHNWIRLTLRGLPPNTNAFGARLEARVGEQTLHATVKSGRSYLSQCEQAVTFGLGEHGSASAVRVYWPGRTQPQELGAVPAGSSLVIEQPADPTPAPPAVRAPE